MEENSLFVGLDNAIYTLWDKYSQNQKTETVIVMHPNTWERIKNYVAHSISADLDDIKNGSGTYRGCKIIRSYDMKSGEYDVYLK